MKYLIFDIECCDGRRICEFGYVLFDENYNLIKRECFTINPEHPFKLSGRKGDSDIKLAFTEQEYYNSPTFPFFYEKIENIINTPDSKIIGFSMQNDRNFLKTACENYKLPNYKFTFLDAQKMYRAYTNSEHVTSIEKIILELNIDGIVLHKSDDDSFAVMEILKTIAQKHDLKKGEKPSVSETLKYLQKCSVTYGENQRKLRSYKESEETTIGDYLKANGIVLE